MQRVEARSAASVVSACAQTSSGAGTVRAGRLQPRMRAAFMRRLDQNHNALLLLNAANRWLGLTLVCHNQFYYNSIVCAVRACVHTHCKHVFKNYILIDLVMFNDINLILLVSRFN